MIKNPTKWLKSTFQFTGSVIPGIVVPALFCGAFSLIISFLYALKLPVSQPILGGIIPSIVLGLLLVFRTNTAYDRFWEGRKLWELLRNSILNLSWQIWVIVKEVEPEDRDRKIAALRLLTAFAISTKRHLRYEPANEELEYLVSPSQYQVLQKIQNMPLEIVRCLGNYLQREYEKNHITINQLSSIQTLMNNLMNAVGGCERILKTPIPSAYVIHLNQLVLIYSLMLPFQFVKDLGWWTCIFVSLVSFALFGIEEIGTEIENPFGYDHNDLPLDKICQGIQQNIEEFIAVNNVIDQKELI